MTNKEIGKIEKMFEEIQVEWKISDFFSVVEDSAFSLESGTFLFADFSWYFRLYPRSTQYPGFIHISFYTSSSIPCNFSIKYNFGLKKLDGTMEKLTTGILKKGKMWNRGEPFLFKLSEIHQRHAELVPSDIFTIKCTMQRENAHSTQRSLLEKQKLKNLIKLDTLSQDFKDLLANKESCDTILHVQDKEYSAHKAVLRARSKVFASMFRHDTLERQTGFITIPDCDPESFGEFLEFLYCGKLQEVSFNSAISLYEISEKYDVQELKTFCSEYLMQTFTVENVCDVVILADKYDDASLISSTQDFFSANLNEIFQTTEWECLLKNNYRSGNKILKGIPKMKVAK